MARTFSNAAQQLHDVTRIDDTNNEILIVRHPVVGEFKCLF